MADRTFHVVSDGTRLRVLTWVPAGEPIASLLVLHGAGEHAGRYDGLASLLRERGIRTAAFDQRGHGESGGHPGHVDEWDRYVRDAREVFDAVLDPARPRFVYGHSMGSLICLCMAMSDPGGARGWVVSGAGIEPAGLAKPHLVALARLLSRVAPRFALDLGIPAEALSHETDVVEAYRSDPLVREKATVRWGTEALDAIDRIKRGAAGIDGPALILHGGADPLCLPSGSAWLHEALGGDSTLAIYDGCLHEPHNDPQYADAAADIGAWIEARVAA